MGVRLADIFEAVLLLYKKIQPKAFSIAILRTYTINIERYNCRSLCVFLR